MTNPIHVEEFRHYLHTIITMYFLFITFISLAHYNKNQIQTTTNTKMGRRVPHFKIILYKSLQTKKMKETNCNGCLIC